MLRVLGKSGLLVDSPLGIKGIGVVMSSETCLYSGYPGQGKKVAMPSSPPTGHLNEKIVALLSGLITVFSLIAQAYRTFMFFRHGEKPEITSGQLTSKGRIAP